MDGETDKMPPAELDSRLWGPPRRPWEMEVLTLLLVAVGICFPLLIQGIIPLGEASVTYSSEGKLGLVWVLGIAGALAAYIAHQHTQVSYNSAPPGSLFAPIFFGVLCYGRAFYYAASKGTVLTLVDGSPKQMCGYLLVLIGVVFFIARVRTLRRKLRYRKLQWDLEVPPTRDHTFFSDLGLAILPLLYPPRMYRFCPSGILIEGFHYLYAIPFRAIDSANEVSQFSAMHDAFYLARSSRSLIQIQLNDHLQPLMIGPSRREEVLAYCQAQSSEHLVVARTKVRGRPKVRAPR